MKFKKFFFLFAIIVSCFTSATAQLKEAISHYKNSEYAVAIPLYKKALRKKGHEENLYDLADCFFHVKDFKNAELLYDRYIHEGPKDTFNIVYFDSSLAKEVKVEEVYAAKPIAYLYLGEALISNNKLDQAKEQLIIYKRIKPQDKRGALFLKACDDIKSWTTMPNKYDVFTIPNINSANSDFSAVDFKNGIAFCSDRGEDIFDESKTGYTNAPYLSMLFVKYKKSDDSTKNLSAAHEFLSKYKADYHTGPISLSKNQDEIYITRVDEFASKKKKTGAHKAKIFHARYLNKKWSKLTSLPFNDDDYTTAHPSISADNNTLYFSSDMPGGFGETDIWYCKKLDSVWSKPINAGEEINTEGIESFPFIDSKGVLFFSSDGHEGIGGLDVYTSRFIDGKFGEAVNLKGGINSPYDDFSIYFTQDCLSGYFASNKPGGVGKDDIYSFKVNDKIIDISGKILLTENTTDGAESVRVLLMSSEGRIMQTTFTDKFGFFKFGNIQSDQYYIVKVDENDPLLKSKKQLFMADETNRIVKVTVVSKDGFFVFQNLPPDLTKLDELDFADTELQHLEVKGYLVSGSDTTRYLSNVKINLTDISGNLLQSRESDKHGYFIFNNILPTQHYAFTLDKEDQSIRLEKKIYVKNLQLKTIKVLENTGSGFMFEVLASDRSTLTMIDEEDTKLNRDVAGKLLNAADNSPIAFGKIILKTQKQEILQTTTTDGFGNFRFYNVVVGQQLNISADESDPKYKDYSKIKITDNKGTVLFFAERKKEGFVFSIIPNDPSTLSLMDEIESPPIKMFSGVVTTLDSNSRQIANLKLILRTLEGEIVATTVTNNKGVFEFKNINPENNYILGIDESDPALSNYNSVVVKSKAGKIIYSGMLNKFSFKLIPNDVSSIELLSEIDTKPPKLMFGYVMSDDAEQKPVANMMLNLSDQNGLIVASSKTNARGKFEFRNIENEENYSVKIDEKDPNYSLYKKIIIKDKNGNILFAGEKENFKYDVIQGDNISLGILSEIDEEITFEMNGFMIAGDGDNKPIGDAEVILYNEANIAIARTKSNANGKFRFTHLKTTDKYSIGINPDDPALKNYKNILLTDRGGKLISTAVRESKSGFVFNILGSDNATTSLFEEIEPGLNKELRGFLFDAESGKKIQSISVQLLDSKGTVVNSVQTKQNGDFKFFGLSSTENYMLQLDVNDPNLKKYKTLVIKDASGKVILQSKYEERHGFRFEVIGGDENVMSLLNEEDTRLRSDISGNLYEESKVNVPLSDVRVVLLDANGNRVESTRTNKKGHFIFRNIYADNNYIVSMEENDSVLTKHKAILLTNSAGKILKRITNAVFGNYKFEILVADQYYMRDMKENDVLMALLPTPASKKITVSPPSTPTEKVIDNGDGPSEEKELYATMLFETAKSRMKMEDRKKLYKLALISKRNKNVKIIIDGHADCRGNSDFNLALSKRRRNVAKNYLIAVGVKSSNIEGTSYGESKITNGCVDGVECTNAQHAENRKIEIYRVERFNFPEKKKSPSVGKNGTF